MVNLITVNSYFNLFPVLTNLIEKDKSSINKKNLVFCEAKISLMAERFICAKNGGSFNTEVYSFGNFLRARKKIDNLLSKEGSSMAVKRILSSNALTCLNKSKAGLAPTMFELIIQLKSAKITPHDIENASVNAKGILKNKLEDIAVTYLEYEKFISENGFVDQSSALSFLPDLIMNSQEIENSDVYLVGFSGFTAQMREIVECLLKKAKSVTAILVEGKNDYAFVNETSNFFREISLKHNIKVFENKIDSDYNEEGQFIVDNLFSFGGDKKEKIKTDKIKVFSAKNPYEEIERVATAIKYLVRNNNLRYRDISIALSDIDGYKDLIEEVFSNLEIPYFLDERKISDSHPLISLILSYINAYKRGLERTELCAFLKNPLFSNDKSLTDAFENYLIKYNVNYGRIHNSFTFESVNGIDILKLEELREKLCNLFKEFSVRKMLSTLNVEEKLKELAENLKKVGESEEASITEQIYDAVIGILNEMDMMLSSIELPLSEYKNVFLSGVSALKLSLIPQYNDAVFIGEFKEVGLAKAKRVFAIGLTSDVPNVSNDVALLSDGDIDELEKIKVLVEPKIRVINHRTRENVLMALSSFSDGLYLSYPIADLSGNKKVKSEILTFFNKFFTLSPFPEYNAYMTFKQGFNSFAKACGEFVEGGTVNGKAYDFTIPSSFYFVADKEKLKPLLDLANKEVKVRLDGNRALTKKVISPTTVEDFYKCPYRAFASHSLKIKEREEGKVGVLSVGNLMHEILSEFVKKAYEINSNNECDTVFDKIKEEILKKEEYKKFLSDASTYETIKRVLNECKKYSYKTYLSIKNSAFNKTQTEVTFSDSEKAEYPAIKLNSGAVKMKGKIDRVDIGEKYFRVLDYKTGKVDSSEKLLFAGVKLQLYLYALAVQGKFTDKEKEIAGVYYLPISDKYEKIEDKEKTLAVGKTVNDRDAILVQDKGFFDCGESEFLGATIDAKSGKIKDTIDEKTLKAYIDYAIKMSERAIDNLDDGVIIASPYQNACEYCEFSAMCGQNGENKRTLGKVDESSFTSALLGEDDE